MLFSAVRSVQMGANWCRPWIPLLLTVSIGRIRVENALQADYIHVKNVIAVTSKLKTMSLDGPEKLQVISDFDRTLTPFKVNDHFCCSTHNVVRDSGILHPEYSTKATALFEKYYPIETSSDLLMEEKVQSMIEWWETSHVLMVKYGLKREHLPEMVAKVNIHLRAGARELFDTAHKYSVPVLVFSAGIEDVISEVIRQRAVHHPCIRILANRLDFSDKGDLLGVKEPLVHSFNKAKIAVHHQSVFEEVKDRTNVLLLGDSTGDPQMADGFEELQSLNIVKVGFLNTREQELLPQYQDLYDIVLTGDASMDTVNILLTYILDQHVHYQ